MDASADRRSLRLVALAIATLIGTAVLPVAQATASPDFSSLRRSTPYVPLFTEADNCTENKTANNPAPAELDSRLGDLTRWFVHFHGEASAQLLLGDACRGASPTTLASKLAARGAWVSNYRNGSYVSQASSSQPLNFGEAADIETRAPLSIGTFWAGNAKPNVIGDDTAGAARLSQTVDAATTTLRVASAAVSRPTGAPTTWPFVNSRGTGLAAGAHSANTHDFVSWVRLDDEIAQIVADPVGQPVFGWDDPQSTKLTATTWGAYQKTKLAGLRAALPGVKFTGNSLGMATACGDDLLANAYDGGVLEHWMKNGAAGSPVWSTAMDQNFRIQAANWPALYWVRWNYDFTGDPAQYRRFSYGSLLLAYRASASRFQYGGPWGLNQPEDLYFWDWGTPKSAPASIADVKVAGSELYRRDFGNGIVLVNPSTAAITYNLGSQY